MKVLIFELVLIAILIPLNIVVKKTCTKMEGESRRKISETYIEQIGFRKLLRVT